MNQFYPFFAWNESVTYPDGSPINDKSILSFEIMSPFGIERWDTWEAQIMLMSRKGEQVMLFYRPEGECETGPTFRDGIPGDIFVGQYDPPGFLYRIGRQFNQGGWNYVMRDLDRDIDLTDDGERNFSDGYGDVNGLDHGQSMVMMVKFQHSQLRVDNIAFHKASSIPDYFSRDPYLFKIGPRYAQIFEPYRYLFFADYDTGDEEVSSVMDFLLSGNLATTFILDPNDIKAAWAADSGVSLTDPNFQSKVNQWVLSASSNPFFNAYGVDFTLPVFSDPNLRLGKNPYLRTIPGTGINQTLDWNPTVGGSGASGVQFFDVTPLEIFPFDGMPTYIPSYFRTEQVIASFGKPYFGPLAVFTLESALWNAGFTFWPNIAKLDFTPQVFEDIILSLEVTDGRTSDIETFPISVVNYAVENYPPYIEDVDDQVFYVGQVNTYGVGAIDPDCAIFSMSGAPATTHTPAYLGSYRTDMDSVFWQFTLNGLASYQYGPWMESTVDTGSGLISFTPKFEGAYDAVLVATDDKGASSIAEFTLFCVNQGTWLNHPPVIIMDWEHPQVANAGEMFYLTSPTLRIEDPDGEQVYYSCNLGSCGTTPNGDFIWSLYTHWPGFYKIEIVAFDIRGGYAIVTIDLEVRPWWSY